MLTIIDYLELTSPAKRLLSSVELASVQNSFLLYWLNFSISNLSQKICKICEIYSLCSASSFLILWLRLTLFKFISLRKLKKIMVWFSIRLSQKFVEYVYIVAFLLLFSLRMDFNFVYGRNLMVETFMNSIVFKQRIDVKIWQLIITWKQIILILTTIVQVINKIFNFLFLNVFLQEFQIPFRKLFVLDRHLPLLDPSFGIFLAGVHFDLDFAAPSSHDLLDGGELVHLSPRISVCGQSRVC